MNVYFLNHGLVKVVTEVPENSPDSPSLVDQEPLISVLMVIMSVPT